MLCKAGSIANGCQSEKAFAVLYCCLYLLAICVTVSCPYRLPDKVRLVSSPNPDWKPGDNVGHPFENKARIQLDPSEEGASAMYPFVISSVIPRPIGFVSSLSKEVSTLLHAGHAMMQTINARYDYRICSDELELILMYLWVILNESGAAK